MQDDVAITTEAKIAHGAEGTRLRGALEKVTLGNRVAADDPLEEATVHVRSACPHRYACYALPANIRLTCGGTLDRPMRGAPS